MADRSRRTFLRLAGLGAVGLLTGCGAGSPRSPGGPTEGPDGDDTGGPEGEPGDGGPAREPEPVVPPETLPLSPNFPMGIASGEVSAAGVVLWTRYGGPHPLRCVVWEMDGDRYVRVAGEAACDVAEAGYVHVDVSGLLPSARYRYAFLETAGDAGALARSTLGHFRAAPAPDALEPMVLGAISCVKLGYSFAPLARAAERDDLQAFLLLGDTTYNDDARTVEQFREKWLASLGTPEWRALRASTSVFATWDDHEVADDWNAEKEDGGIVAAATKTWFENLPVRRDPAAPGRIYRNVRLGRTVEIFALDCKTEKRPSAGLYLSRAQMDWLKAGLERSTAVFKIIMNSVPIGDFPFPFTAVDGARWTGFPAQRTEILTHVESKNIQGVLWLSGDFHLGKAGRVAETGPGSKSIEVLAGPGGQFPNPGIRVLNGPLFDFVTGTNNYVTLHLDPRTGDCRVVFHDGGGSAFAERTYRLVAS